VPRPRRQPERLFRLEGSPGLPPSTRGYGAAGVCPVGLCPVARHLWQSTDDAGAARQRPRGRPPTDGPPDARERPQGPAEAAVQADDRQHHAWPVAPNLLDQDFAATRPDEKWGADISYIWTREGWLYLAVVIDLFARRVVGWSTGDRLHRDLALAALRQALVIPCPAAGLIHHSDRGSQYCSIDYQAELSKRGVLISMSSKGNCYDNAMVERFFKTLKSELVWRTVFCTRREAELAIARYIDGFYNPVRRHSALSFTSPAQFENRAAD
jgi:transposase InsO family protein